LHLASEIKKIMEDLRLELWDCVKYNESMYVAIQDVLSKQNL
jgi:hypothetical protein